MKRIVGDLLRCAIEDGPDAICLPSDGSSDRHGDVIMRTTVARRVYDKWPETAALLEASLKERGLVVSKFGDIWTDGKKLFPTPTKNGFPMFALVSVPTKRKTCVRYSDLISKFRLSIDPLSNPGPYAGWMAKSPIDLISSSMDDLVALADKHGWKSVYLPKLACERGNREWEELVEVYEEKLDDRFSMFDLWWDISNETRVGRSQGVIKAGSLLRVVLPPNLSEEYDAEVLACYGSDMHPFVAVDLNSMRGNESLYVSVCGVTRLLSIGPGFKRNRDYVVAVRGES